jgi:hypothetical protein
MVVVMMVVVMMARTSRCLGHAPRKENGCGDHGERHTWPG